MAPTVTKYPLAGGNNTAANWNILINELTYDSDFITTGLVSTAEAGTSLNLEVTDGAALCNGVRHGIVGTAGKSVIAMTNNTTNYVAYDPATLDFHIDTDNTLPSNGVRIASVVTSGGDITTITDTRILMAPYDHTKLANKGTNTHTQIDTHISDVSPHTAHLILATGSYVGNNSIDRAIAHGLGRTPKVIFIIAKSTGDAQSFTLFNNGAIVCSNDFNLGMRTALNGTNFYVGDADGYRGNGSGVTYYFIAIG